LQQQQQQQQQQRCAGFSVRHRRQPCGRRRHGGCRREVPRPLLLAPCARWRLPCSN
jgi:hypothetical protein